jgi:hypothetical protein
MKVLNSKRALQLHKELQEAIELQYKALFEAIPSDLGHLERMNVMLTLTHFKLGQERAAYKTAVEVDFEVARAEIAMQAAVYSINNQGKT